MKLVVSDAHAGLMAAIRISFQGASWQRCRVHFIRNVLVKVPKTAGPNPTFAPCSSRAASAPSCVPNSTRS